MDAIRLSDLIDIGLGHLLGAFIDYYGAKYHEQDDYALIAQIKKERDEALQKNDSQTLTDLCDELHAKLRIINQKGNAHNSK